MGAGKYIIKFKRSTNSACNEKYFKFSALTSEE